MATKQAEEIYEKLFSRQETRYHKTDPEFAELFESFAFDEVRRTSRLDDRTRMLLILASLIAMHTLTEYEIILKGALQAGVTPVEIKELIYQAVPYAGVARIVDVLDITNAYFEKAGILLPLPGQSTTNRETRFEKGLAVQKSIFGETIDQMYEKSPKNQLIIQQLLSANCFGDYYTRGVLDVKTRELITFTILISLGGCEPQVCGHIQGNVQVGNDKELLLDAVTQVLPYIGYPRSLNAIRCLNECIPEE